MSELTGRDDATRSRTHEEDTPGVSVARIIGGSERLAQLLANIEREHRNATLSVRHGLWLSASIDLQAIALWADDALAELDGLNDLGDAWELTREYTAERAQDQRKHPV